MSDLSDAVGRIRARASKRGTECTITADWLAENTPRRCPCCDVLMERGGDRRTSPSVDRINNALGYTPANCWVICFRCNQIKGEHASVGELEADAGRAHLVAMAWRRHLAGWRWPMRDDLRPPAVKPMSVTERAALAVADAGVPVGPRWLAKHLGLANSTAHKRLSRAHQQGLLTRTSRGRYVPSRPKSGAQ